MLPQIFDEIAADRGFGRERAAQGEQITTVKPVRKLLDGADVDNEITDDKAGTLVLEIKDNKINVTAKSSSKIDFGNIVRSTKVGGIIYTFNSGEFVNSLQTKN